MMTTTTTAASSSCTLPSSSAAALSHAALYFKGGELPLNSSIASHDFAMDDDDNNENQNNQDGDDHYGTAVNANKVNRVTIPILETCPSPYISAALSSMLRDMESIKKKIPDESQRCMESMSLLLDI